MIRGLVTAVLLLLPAMASANRLSESRFWNGQHAPRGESLLQAAVLANHNSARRAYGAVPLVWDAELAARAQAYAAVLARGTGLRHSATATRPGEGENLWMGTRGAYSYPSMVDALTGERRDYRPGRFPDVSRTGDWADVGHYTQIVWPTTTHVGCGTASNAGFDFLVCRYSPPGNIVGMAMR